MTSVTVPPQLCLVVETAAGAREGCAAALNAARIASIIVTPPPNGVIDRTEAVAIVAAGHAGNIAVLIEDDVNLAKSLGADGVHLAWHEDAEASYTAARAALGPNAIVGVDAGYSRHDAMSLGESGADYVAFSLPRHAADQETAEQQHFDLIEWWAEIFEVPVIAMDVESAEQAEPLAEAGADFVATRMPLDLTPDQVTVWISDIARGLEARLPAT
jgi:thiamine-phosphate pyrophosphorylase